MEETYDYFADTERVSKTMLNLFIDSRMEFHLTYNTGELPQREPTKRMSLGTIGHAVLLEDAELDSLVSVYPPGVLSASGSLVPKRAADFEAEHPGSVFMKFCEYQAAEKMLQCVRQHKDLMAVIEQATSREQPYFADLFGVPSKCKPDILCDLGDEVVLYDLKFMENIDPSSFARSAKRFRYYLQDCHYSAVVSESTGKPTRMRFWCIETKFPHRAMMYSYDDSSLQMARESHERELLALAECRKTGDWSDVWENMLAVMPWEIGESADSMISFNEEV